MFDVDQGAHTMLRIVFKHFKNARFFRAGPSGPILKTLLRDILDLKLRMKDPRVELVETMNSLHNMAKDSVQKLHWKTF